MKNYDDWSPKFFTVTQEEVDKLNLDYKFSSPTYKNDLAKIQKKYGEGIVTFTLKKLPLTWRRSKMDNACLLVVEWKDGSLQAKRYNNTQWLSIGR